MSTSKYIDRIRKVLLKLKSQGLDRDKVLDVTRLDIGSKICNRIPCKHKTSYYVLKKYPIRISLNAKMHDSKILRRNLYLAALAADIGSSEIATILMEYGKRLKCYVPNERTVQKVVPKYKIFKEKSITFHNYGEGGKSTSLSSSTESSESVDRCLQDMHQIVLIVDHELGHETAQNIEDILQCKI